ncbi:CRISPR-associated protein Cse1 [Rhodoblastus acidophilus]|uniref:CRISPR-associated protein Cse1 n=1 Tax=Rhodoblastus acidophilus TaxID=1074 RepID=A0A6N8DQ71_RHOAC|nr:CRISPR-associated protein Cse1 [Rhodoblastus acidophilus]MCW2274733.1 CRISPR system Cascade subunit CasA [Rhodoblastus acidophilus]MTV31685.1 CRISPR-associated protein Cse1 [Rhodoblastus acidophilus]
MFNLLTQPLIAAAPLGPLSLPGLLAALSRDEVDSLPALRPHQAPAWHMFLVQLGALAMHRSGRTELPREEGDWCDLLRGLTPDFADDAPWRLVVEDWTKPAFLQPPVPKAVKLENTVPTPDAMDLLITAKNHDLKQAVAQAAAPEDWIFALVSLQTGEGYGGRSNYGIARMNGGSSSRPMVTLAPLAGDKSMTPRSGAWFRRNVRTLLETRHAELQRHAQFAYPATGGLGLIWIAPWPDDAQLHLRELDIWFIEICRRVRICADCEGISAVKGLSKSTRIDAKAFNGALGDPFAPIHRTENKGLTLGDGDFDYSRLTTLLLSGDWELPILARPASFERTGDTMAVVCMALARGNSRTDGFKSRILPLDGRKAQSLGARRQALFELAQAQIEDIDKFDKALGYALAMVAAGGDRDKIKKEHYRHAAGARAAFDRTVDSEFFDHLWARDAAQQQSAEALKAEQTAFHQALLKNAEAAFEAAVAAVPCASLFRPRAEARARSAFAGRLRHEFPGLFAKAPAEDANHVA